MSEIVDPILIERGPLLNFWGAAINMRHPHGGDVRAYRSVEHRFQAMKSTCALGADDLRGRRLIHDGIANQYRPAWAKREGKLVEIDVAKWDGIAYLVMLEAVVCKFAQHADLRRQLLATGDAPLVEHRPDPIWGDALDGSGQNLMGKALMYTRGLLR